MLNKVALMGRITTEPELKYTTSNVAVCRFSIAVEQNHKNANGERGVDFININAWRNNAEIVNKYFGKGSLICISGSITTGSYTDKNGVKRNTFAVNAEEIFFTGERKEQSNINAGYPYPSQAPHNVQQNGNAMQAQPQNVQQNGNVVQAPPRNAQQNGNVVQKPYQDMQSSEPNVTTDDFVDMPMLDDDDLPF